MSPTLGRQFGDLISVSVMLSLLLYIYACLAIWHYAAEAPGAFVHDRAFAFVGILFCLAILLLSGTQLLGWTAAVVFITFPFYPLCRGGKRLRPLTTGQHD
jgi:arginine:agmatine antiporter